MIVKPGASLPLCYNSKMTETTASPPPEPSADQDQGTKPQRFKLPGRLLMRDIYAFLVPVAFVAGIGAGYLFWGRETASGSPPAATQVPSVQTAPSEPQAPTRFDISVDDDPVYGPADAPITIVEFSDFNCGYCRKFYVETFWPLLEAYPSQIRFVYRDLPVVGGFEAAQAAQCAHEQGAFWEYHDLLFTGTLGHDRAGYLQYAEDLGLDSDALAECFDSGRYAEEVEADARYAFNLGANGTPTFFVNGIPMVGAQPLANFVQVIEAELAN
jgi:protein-disulfide isomerase